jgi:ketosteroid isomerase-like protein
VSGENVEFVRRAIETANAGAWEGDETLALLHPEIQIHTASDWPGPSLYEGRDGALALGRELTSVFDDYRWTIEQLVDGGDCVVALVRSTGSSKSTGLEVDWPFGVVYRDFRDGMVAEVRFFLDHKGAIEAAGLTAQPGVESRD